MAAISKVIRLSQKLRGTEPSMLTLYIGFVGRRFQKKYCRIHHANESANLEAILKKMATIFNIMRLIFETMRQRNATVGSTHIIYGQHNSDSVLLRASHNCGHNLAGCCGYLFYIVLDITDGVEYASAFSLLTNIDNEINTSTRLIFTEPDQNSSSESDMCSHNGYVY